MAFWLGVKASVLGANSWAAAVSREGDWDRRHPDFEPGNVLAAKHGAYSNKYVAPLAAELVAQAVTDAPWITAPRFAAAVAAWSRAEAAALLLHSWLLEQGLHDPRGRLRGAEQALNRAENRAAAARSALGLTPAAAARLGRDVTATRLDLAAIWAADEGDVE